MAGKDHVSVRERDSDYSWFYDSSDEEDSVTARKCTKSVLTFTCTNCKVKSKKNNDIEANTVAP